MSLFTVDNTIIIVIKVFEVFENPSDFALTTVVYTALTFNI